MIKNVLLFVLTLTFVQAGHALGASIVDTPWEKGNIDTLRALDKGRVAQFMTGILGNFSGHGDCDCVKPKDVGEFTWADLQGDGRLELVASLDVNGRAFFNALVIFGRDSSGKITHQEVEGWMIRNLGKVVRDLNGDGKRELIIPTVLHSYSTAETFTWPTVYRLENGKYVEASRDFPAFYENEVLPQLDKKISKSQTEVIPTLDKQETQAVFITERAKILHVIGRDPTAGLQQAYQWMSSDDPRLLQDAAVIFGDIGGHKAEERAVGIAEGAAWKRELDRERAAHPGG